MSIKEFIGHEDVRQRLNDSLANQSTAEALLFYGPDGVGKATVAKAFAYALVQGFGALSITYKDHVDVIIIDLEEAAHFHTIQTIRSIKEIVYIPPLSGKKKVVIIKKAHKMQKAAANALLKCLEEPSFSTVFILLAPSLLDVLPTIASRCAKIAFHPLKKQELLCFIHQKKEVSEEKAQEVIKTSLGLFSKANEALEEKEEEWKKTLFDLLIRFPFLTYEETSKAFSSLEEYLEQNKELFFTRLFDHMSFYVKDLCYVRSQLPKNLLTFKSRVHDYELAAMQLKPSLEGVMKMLEQFHFSYSLHVKLKTALEAFIYRLYR